MFCTKPFYDKCPECECRYLITCESAESDDDLYFCFATREEMYKAFDQIEHYNFYQGIHIKPKSAIRFLPKGSV